MGSYCRSDGASTRTIEVWDRAGHCGDVRGRRRTGRRSSVGVGTGASIVTDGEILEVLGDECARQVLAAGADAPVTVEDLVEICGVSASTVYRRLRQLEALGLMRSDTDIRSNGGNRSVYITDVQRLELAVSPDGLDLSIDTDQRRGEQVLDLLQDIEFETADIDFTQGTVDLRVAFDPSTLNQFLEIWELVGADEET